MDIIELAILGVLWLGFMALVRDQRRSYWGLFAFILQLVIAEGLQTSGGITYGATPVPMDNSLYAGLALWIFTTVLWTIREGKKK